MSGEQAAESGRVSQTARIVFSAAAVGAFVLGVLGFRQFLPGHDEYGRGILDLVYYSLQLFVLDAAPLQTATHLPVTLQIARFAAPAVTAYLIVLAAQAMIIRRWASFRIGRVRDHSILCGPPELARRLADQIRGESGGTVVVVGDSLFARRHGRFQVDGDPRQRAVLDRAGLGRARELIAVGPDTVRNAEVASAVHAGNQGRDTPVTCYAEAGDGELFQAVAGQGDAVGPGRVDVFDRHDRTARALIEHLAPYPPDDPRSAVLVIGYAGLGRALVGRLVRFWSGDPGPPGAAVPSLCVLDGGVPADVVRRRHGSPAGVTLTLRQSESAWLTTLDDLLVPAADGAKRIPGRVYVCLDDDAAGITAGDIALRLLAEHDVTVVVAVAHSAVLGEAARDNSAVRTLGKARMVLVSVLRTVYAMAAIRTGTNEELARAIHETYLAQVRDAPEDHPAAKPWDELPDYLKDSNREQAWDIGHKLALVGLSAVRAGGPAAAVRFSDADVEKLARAEHVRWVKERTAKGWRRGDVRDDVLKRHPDLVDWDYLSEAARNKDRSAVRAIPEHLAAAGLAIVRSTAATGSA
jgi:RyR domain-containing protein